MTRLTVDGLDQLRESLQAKRAARDGDARAKITVHMGTCGISAGAREIMAELMIAIEEAEVSDVIVTASGCAGMCSREPMATVEILGEAPVKYVDLKPDIVRRVFQEHVLEGKIVKENALAIGSERTGG